MRPINLIPQEQRRAHGGASRAGPLAYIVVGALGALLVGVVMLVLAANQISDREGEVEQLKAQKVAATARADRLAPYASFEQVAQQRTQLIAELADGRFDWERVFRQLSLVLPPQVNLTTLTGSAGGGVETGATEGGVTELKVPSLALAGCAPGQDTVAALVASLKEIDGVTRVGLSNSTISEEEGGSSEGACPKVRPAKFDLVIAFDQAPPSLDGTEAIAAEESTEAAEGGASETESTSGSEAPAEGESQGTASTPAEPAG